MCVLGGKVLFREVTSVQINIKTCGWCVTKQRIVQWLPQIVHGSGGSLSNFVFFTDESLLCIVY